MQTITLIPDEILRILPEDVTRQIRDRPSNEIAKTIELRLRIGRRPQLVGPDMFLQGTVTHEHLRYVMAMLTKSSLYAVETELRNGFITLSGGHRVGIAGKVVLDTTGKVQTIRDISSVNIRFAKEVRGSAKVLLSMLWQGRPPLRSALLFGPPASGKTTLLRDLARMLGSGEAPLLRPLRVALIDERSELAGSVAGVPQFEVGTATDVLDGCPKQIGMVMALRALSPEVIIADELGGREDALAVADLAKAGIALIGTVHAGTIQELWSRDGMRAVTARQLFDRYIQIAAIPTPGRVVRVYDKQLREVMLP